ncbi:Imm51 family immunity protein [Rhodanobacter ginsengiterrae]|uniref:Imm51 family immunity protein n=1 Tax=Rhodanobacter ginsengiterrae TaxID=2008451 RepID=UPI003CEFA75A
MKTFQHLLLVFSLLLPVGAHAVNDPVEGSRITELSPGEYSYNYFNYRPEVLAFFESKGLQGGGYTWEGLAKAGLELTDSELADLIEFDPEGDALFATSSSRPALEQLDSIVKRLGTDSAFRDQCIAHASESGELE